jgi:hypothetical protein
MWEKNISIVFECNLDTNNAIQINDMTTYWFDWRVEFGNCRRRISHMGTT